jgi:endonuclease-3
VKYTNTTARKERLAEVQAALVATYPQAYCELLYTNPLELLLATILSAQCTDVQVNKVTPQLFAKYPTAQALAQAPLAEIEEAIKAIGLYRNKAKNIQAACQILVKNYGGNVPDEMAQLVALPGVGRKTANVVLGNAFGKNYGIVVDTHVARLSARLRFTRMTDPVKIEKQLMKIVPQAEWTNFSHRLIFHGRRRCKARQPDCENCELKELCPSRGKV